MSILVCGGAGYIGSHFCYRAVSQKESIVVLDNLSTGHVESLPSNTKFYQGDIRDKFVLDKIFTENDIEAVVHFAADALVCESMKDPLTYFDNNVHGTLVLLESMVKHHVNKIIFSSTCATYGEPKSIPITENNPTLPINPYGESKLMMENIIKWMDKIHNIRYVSLRYFNAAGAVENGCIGEDHKYETHLIPLVLQVPLKKRECVFICGDDYPTKDGTCIRDYIHVLDLADAHIQALTYLRNGYASDVFNLGTGNGFSVKDIIASAEAVTCSKIKTVIAPRREGDPPELVASNKKARDILRWVPKFININQIMSSAWAWHKSHPNGY